MKNKKPLFRGIIGGMFLALTLSLSAQDAGVPLAEEPAADPADIPAESSSEAPFGFGFGGSEGSGADSGGGSFGFSSGDSASSGFSAGFSAAIGASVHGRAQAKFQIYGKELESGDSFKNIRLGDIFLGRINFNASASNAEGLISLNLTPNLADPAKSLAINEAYVRVFFGMFSIEGGFRKLTWGKADSLGPLDVINPLDYSDLSNMTDLQEIKIARPLVHAAWNLGSFSKLEGVFVPWFEGHRLAFDPNNRWTPRQYRELPDMLFAEVVGRIPPELQSSIASRELPGINPAPPDMSTLEYTQGGLRFTTTLGPADFGVQYYSGFLPRPAAGKNQAGFDETIGNAMAAYMAQFDPNDPQKALDAAIAALEPDKMYTIKYNRFHQIGADYAQVIRGFNLRGEFGVNLTGDIAGDDGLVYNPALAWSAGFDRDIAGIMVNLQINETIRLMQHKVGSDPLTDVEAGLDPTGTRLTLLISRKFFRDELELKATTIWGFEDMDCYFIPALIWTKDAISLELSGGVFGGKDQKGELSQYRDNHFIKTLLTYTF